LPRSRPRRQPRPCGASSVTPTCSALPSGTRRRSASCASPSPSGPAAPPCAARAARLLPRSRLCTRRCAARGITSRPRRAAVTSECGPDRRAHPQHNRGLRCRPQRP
jgi:hypothetical protein